MLRPHPHETLTKSNSECKKIYAKHSDGTNFLSFWQTHKGYGEVCTLKCACEVCGNNLDVDDGEQMTAVRNRS